MVPLVLFLSAILHLGYADNEPKTDHSYHDSRVSNNEENIYEPWSPLVHCSYLPYEFIECAPLLDLKGNKTAKEVLGTGCVKFGGQTWEEMEFTTRNCTVLEGIECYGNRTFLKSGFPCVKYAGHYFLTSLLYSILLGFLGMDRFCLGHPGTAVGKLLTIGGVGIWWIVDIVLIITGHLLPENQSNWNPVV